MLTILHSLMFGLLLQPASSETPSAAVLLKQLSGVWTAPETRTPRTTELDERVFGAGASDVRNVTLTIQPSGQARLSISTAVIGRTGRRFAPSVVEARLTIADPVSSTAGRLAPAVTVASAEERYLDGGNERWPIEGARVSISMSGPAPTDIEFRFDTKDGRGSFGTELKRRPQSSTR